jgi:hypothetical protein
MKTRINELFGIRHPIVLSGMGWISVPKMVAAVSEAGGLGILATGPLSADGARALIREIRRLTDKPFGANASLMLPGAQDNARVLIEEKVPVINCALGKGDWLVKETRAYGGKVISTVPITTTPAGPRTTARSPNSSSGSSPRPTRSRKKWPWRWHNDVRQREIKGLQRRQMDDLAFHLERCRQQHADAPTSVRGAHPLHVRS